MRRILILAIVFLVGSTQMQVLGGEIIDIGSRLELFVDDYLIDEMTGVKLILHKPIPREVVIVHDEPWEGNNCGYQTVFQDGELYRMYYRGFRGTNFVEHEGMFICYAESKDGIHWTKPELGIVEFKGSKKNNIIWGGEGTHAFAPFKDTRPGVPADERYKALCIKPTDSGTDNFGNAPGEWCSALFALKSADGIHWSSLQTEPVIPNSYGSFDSQNLGFWDSVRGRYVAYFREFRDERYNVVRAGSTRIRDIRTATSKDFINWGPWKWLDYGDIPSEQLYTNQITPYYRAPHIFMGFPMRYVESRRATVGYPAGISDGVFMTSRDGLHFKRWGEALIRPGLQIDRWGSHDNPTTWGILETKSTVAGMPNELSIYSREAIGRADKSPRLRRYTVRIDGFVSVQAPLSGGGFTTKALIFEGKKLLINFSSSAAGGIRIEIQDVTGKPISGFALADCPEIYGDQIEHIVTWKNGSDIGKLAGKPIRLRFVIKDADLFSMRFRR